MIEYLFFVIFKYLIYFSALMVVVARNPIYSVLFLVLVFCNSAGLVILMGVEFLAFVFIVVYVGAIAVLFLFVVMMINFKMLELSTSLLTYFPLSAYIIAILSFEFSTLFLDNQNVLAAQSLFTNNYTNWFETLNHITNIESLGLLLYTHYLPVFVICAFILFVAMVGSITLTLLHRSNMKRQDIYYQVNQTPIMGVKKFN
jgi:NADH-quinone oxidoreductase subunit J